MTVTVRNAPNPSAANRPKTSRASAWARAWTKAGSRESSSNVSCSPTDFRSQSFETASSSIPRAFRYSSWPHFPNHAVSEGELDAPEVGHGPDPLAVEHGLALRADPRNHPDPERIEEALHVLGPHDGQAIRLPEVRGDLRHELVRPDADRAGQPLALEDLRLESSGMGFAALHRAEGRQIHVGLVDARPLERVGPRAMSAMILPDTSR